jgi:intron-binding protein aquarius
MLEGNSARFQLLEFSGYLENYLWFFYSSNVCTEHVMSIILMINEKYKNGLSALDELSKDENKCTLFYNAVVELYLQKQIKDDLLLEQYMLFLINSFRSMENLVLRKCALRYLSLPIWESLSQTRLSAELGSNAQLANHWKGYQAQKADLHKAA